MALMKKLKTDPQETESTTNPAILYLRIATKDPVAKTVTRVRTGAPPSAVKSIIAGLSQAGPANSDASPAVLRPRTIALSIANVSPSKTSDASLAIPNNAAVPIRNATKGGYRSGASELTG